MYFEAYGPLFYSVWMVRNHLEICWTAGERLF